VAATAPAANGSPPAPGAEGGAGAPTPGADAAGGGGGGGGGARTKDKAARSARRAAAAAAAAAIPAEVLLLLKVTGTANSVVAALGGGVAPMERVAINARAAVAGRHVGRPGWRAWLCWLWERAVLEVRLAVLGGARVAVMAARAGRRRWAAVEGGSGRGRLGAVAA